MRMDGVMSQRSAALVYLMWPLPCRQSTCVHTHAFGRTHTHRHIWVYDSKSWVWCVCEWVEDEEKGQRAPGDVVYPADRETEKESGRERGAWHCSSLSDGSSSGLRHGLPLISLSLDMKMEEKSRDEGGWRDQSRNLCWVLCQIDFYFILLFFILRQTIKLTYLLTRTLWMAKNRTDELWLTTDVTWTSRGLVPAHESVISFWSIDGACNKYIWPRASPS